MDRSVVEIEGDYIDNMGEELGKIFYILTNEFHWMIQKWGEYKILFGSSQEHIDILNARTGTIFLMFKNAFLNDIVMHLMRLTDPARTVGKDNLSFNLLPSHLTDENLKTEADKILIIINEKCNFCRDWRNRSISHKDYNLHMQEDTLPLEDGSIDQFDDIFSCMNKLINQVYSFYFKNSTIEFGVISSPKGAHSLLRSLKIGNDKIDENQKMNS